MLIITAAWTQRGWSRNDHLIDDTRLDAVIGRTYGTVAAAKRAVTAKADPRGYGSFEYVLPDGSSFRVGCEPSLPGRPNYGPQAMKEKAL